MCGIAGFKGQGSKENIESMINTLKHRGPDDTGISIDGDVCLAQARLSILDLSPLGHQPMSDSSESVNIIFNGEIYNFKEIRQDLENKNYKFKSNSDTEVIIYSYIEYGLKCFSMFEGMFSIAIHDKRNGDLILSRDRMGKKPLYYLIKDKNIVFGSELKAIKKHPLFTKKISDLGLRLYLKHDYIPTPLTIYEDVYKLEPGSYLIFDKENKVYTEKFWDLNIKENINKDKNLRHYVEEFDNIFLQSVKKRMISDVPLGIFLSGGIDSSLIALYAIKLVKNPKDIKTFSIGFENKSFDETKYANEVAKVLGTDHHSKIVKQEEIIDIINEIGYIFDEPVADASVIPTYILSKFSREKVTVALSGDGADELFFGYPTFQADIAVRFFLPILSFSRGVLNKFINILPFSTNNFSFAFKARKFIEGIHADDFIRHNNWLGSFDDKTIKKILSNKYNDNKNEFENYVKDKYSYYKKLGKNNGLSSLYLRTYLMDQVLVKVDRASMRASLEARAPFLDSKIVDFALSLPYSLKIKNFKTKYILRHIASKSFSRHIFNRPKKGFGLPISEWLRKDLKPILNEYLSKENIEKYGIFNYEEVKKLIDDHMQGKIERRKELWNLLTLHIWLRSNFD
jgi:asparagine synthase (glutamine-hydrolysing)